MKFWIPLPKVQTKPKSRYKPNPDSNSVLTQVVSFFSNCWNRARQGPPQGSLSLSQLLWKKRTKCQQFSKERIKEISTGKRNKCRKPFNLLLILPLWLNYFFDFDSYQSSSLPLYPTLPFPLQSVCEKVWQKDSLALSRDLRLQLRIIKFPTISCSFFSNFFQKGCIYILTF